MGRIKSTSNKCRIPHCIVEEVVMLQGVGQQHGWAIDKFDMEKIWEYNKGEDIKIAVVDSGCDLDHPDLVNNLLPGVNFVKPGTPPFDDHQHGTHISGILAATDNNMGMVGVAPMAKIIPVKVLNAAGNGNMVHVAAGIKWSVDNGADIICMSLGSPRPLKIVRNALVYAHSKGVPVFVAAGNKGITKEIYYPANYPQVIAVGSVDENLDRSDFSNTGDNLDFLAPGGRIFSTVPDDWYAILSGTSMASPFLVGLAALCLSHQRKSKKGKPFKSVEDYISLFKNYTIPIANKKYANKVFYQGYGIVDPRKLVSWFKELSS